MPNAWYSDFPERDARDRGAIPPPKLRTGQKAHGMAEKSFRWPALKGRPRKVFTPRVPRVHTRVHEEY